MTSIALRQDVYYLIRFKPTGDFFGKRGARSLVTEHLFETSAGCKTGIAWMVRCRYSYLNHPGSVDKSNYEVVPVQVSVRLLDEVKV